MDYENFKERLVEDLKDKLYEKGVEADDTGATENICFKIGKYTDIIIDNTLRHSIQ